MDEMIFFRRNAILADLCKEYNDKWAACHGDKEKLTRLVLMRQAAPYFATFCYNGNGLSKEYCLSEFHDYINGRVFDDVDGVSGYTSAMYIDMKDDIRMDADTAQMLWCDGTSVTIPKTKCPTVYVSNHSDVKLKLEGFSTVSIYLFDESNITVEETGDECNVIVYKYSSRATVETGKFCLANVKIFLKTLRL